MVRHHLSCRNIWLFGVWGECSLRVSLHLWSPCPAPFLSLVHMAETTAASLNIRHLQEADFSLSVPCPNPSGHSATWSQGPTEDPAHHSQRVGVTQHLHSTSHEEQETEWRTDEQSSREGWGLCWWKELPFLFLLFFWPYNRQPRVPPTPYL